MPWGASCGLKNGTKRTGRGWVFGKTGKAATGVKSGLKFGLKPLGFGVTGRGNPELGVGN